MAEITRLIGDDGYVSFGEVPDSAYVGDDTSDLDELAGGTTGDGGGEGLYQVVAIAATGTAFDWTDPEVGDYFWDDGSMVLTTGDEVNPLPMTERESVKSFSIELSRNKIDTSTLKDKQKTYRMGKADVSGSMTMVTTVGENLVSDRFMDRMNVDNTGGSPARTIQRMIAKPFYFVGFLQKDDSTGEKQIAVVGKVDVESNTEGAEAESAQQSDVSFAPVGGDRLQKVIIEH